MINPVVVQSLVLRVLSSIYYAVCDSYDIRSVNDTALLGSTNNDKKVNE